MKDLAIFLTPLIPCMIKGQRNREQSVTKKGARTRRRKKDKNYVTYTQAYACERKRETESSMSLIPARTRRREKEKEFCHVYESLRLQEKERNRKQYVTNTRAYAQKKETYERIN